MLRTEIVSAIPSNVRVSRHAFSYTTLIEARGDTGVLKRSTQSDDPYEIVNEARHASVAIFTLDRLGEPEDGMDSIWRDMAMEDVE